MKHKSFILHTDTLCVIKEMTNSKAGMLVKAILAYQAREDGTSGRDEFAELFDEAMKDRTIRIVFAAFKAQFERDAEAYEEAVARNRSNGKRGGRPRKAAVPEEEREESSAKPSVSEETSRSAEASVEPPKPSETSGNPAPASAPALSATTATDGAKEDNGKNLERYFSPVNASFLEQAVAELYRANPDVATVADFRRLASEVVAEWELSGATHTDFRDWARHLLDHVRIKNRIEAQHAARIRHNQPAKPKNPFDEYREQIKRRQQQQGVDFR